MPNLKVEKVSIVSGVDALKITNIGGQALAITDILINDRDECSRFTGWFPLRNGPANLWCERGKFASFGTTYDLGGSKRNHDQNSRRKLHSKINLRLGSFAGEHRY